MGFGTSRWQLDAQATSIAERDGRVMTAAAHRDLASRIHVRNAAESGQTRTDANAPTRTSAGDSDIGTLWNIGRDRASFFLGMSPSGPKAKSTDVRSHVSFQG
jgi:hypothetical protein